MFALFNIKTRKFYRRENAYRNCEEVNTFVEAQTFKTKKDAEYTNCLIKTDYVVIDIDDAVKMNKLG